MNQNTTIIRRSIRLSQGLLAVFAAATVFMDLRCLWVFQWAAEKGILGQYGQTDRPLFLACLLGCSVPAYILIYSMFRLLRIVERGEVFTRRSIGLLNAVSLCCFAAALICLGFGLRFPVLLVVTVAAGFVGLIVRIVKNVFQQALAMKDELALVV